MPAVILTIMCWLVWTPPVRAEEGRDGGGPGPIRLDVFGGQGVSTAPPAGTDIGALIGAGAFYSAGYTGTRAVAANIENNHAWNGHETLGHLTTFLDAVGYATPAPTGHPTAVSGLLAGRRTSAGGTHQQGIAFGAELWSGAFGIDPYVGVVTPLVRAMQAGVNGRRADVVNSSWSTILFDPAATEPNPALLIDALVAANGQTYVCSAGNAGPGANSLTPPASCYNTLAVAALAGPDYTAVAGFSSRGGSDYYNPVTGQTVAGARATVDLAAPGQMMLVATYHGAASAADAYVVGQGTSFASPLVAGGAALLVDVGYDRFGGGSAVDGRVVKSVLQNAARPTHGWDNGTRRGADGVWRTTQALDFAAGAGAVDLERGFHQFTDGTTDVPGLGGGEVLRTGWDFGRVEEDGFVEYKLDALPAGTFRGTLNWWVRRSATFRPWGHDYDLAGAGDDSFVNLDLQLWRLTGDGPADRVLVGASESLYNNTELLAISLADAGRYALRVLWAGVHYDRLGTADGVDFGLAWWGEPVPEPAGLVLILALTGRFVVPRRGPRKAS